MSGPPAISLPRFAGPLDVLLELVRRNQVNITEIPIAEITRQYLDYMHQAAQFDIDLGAEFTYMAATLIQLKARSLLPVDPQLRVTEPDGRQNLIRQLLDHTQMQQAAEFLHQRLELAGAVWTKSAASEVQQSLLDDEDIPTDRGSMNLLDLVRLAKKALETAQAHDLLVFQTEEISIEEMISWLQPHLAQLRSGDSLPLGPLFHEQPDRPRQISLFLAVLELSKNGALQLDQKDTFAPIYLIRSGGNGTTVP